MYLSNKYIPRNKNFPTTFSIYFVQNTKNTLFGPFLLWGSTIFLSCMATAGPSSRTTSRVIGKAVTNSSTTSKSSSLTSNKGLCNPMSSACNPRIWCLHWVYCEMNHFIFIWSWRLNLSTPSLISSLLYIILFDQQLHGHIYKKTQENW